MSPPASPRGAAAGHSQGRRQRRRTCGARCGLPGRPCVQQSLRQDQALHSASDLGCRDARQAVGPNSSRPRRGLRFGPHRNSGRPFAAFQKRGLDAEGRSREGHGFPAPPGSVCQQQGQGARRALNTSSTAGTCDSRGQWQGAGHRHLPYGCPVPGQAVRCLDHIPLNILLPKTRGK